MPELVKEESRRIWKTPFSCKPHGGICWQVECRSGSPLMDASLAICITKVKPESYVNPCKGETISAEPASEGCGALQDL